jgi:hypothetical protein
MKMKKIIKISTSVLAVLLICVTGYFAAGYFASVRAQVDTPPEKVKLSPGTGVPLGGKVTAEIDFPLPLCKNVEQVEVIPPDGTVVSGENVIKWHKLRFAHRNWKISVVLSPLKKGKNTPGTLRFNVKRRGEKPQTFSAEIPAFDIKPGVPAQKLELAPEAVVGKEGISPWYWLLLLLIPAGIWLAVYLRRPRKPRELTEWEKAFKEFSGLREKIASQRLTSEQAFISLTEFMRRYLERRFGLPVTRSTAQEFVGIMDKYGSTFPAESRPFLREFLNEADLVKFARAVPEKALVERSVSSAGQFVEHTRPESEVKNV